MIFYDYGIPWHFDLSGAMSQLILSFTQVVPPVWIMKRWRSLVKKGDGTWIHHNSSYSYLDIFSSIFAFFGEAFNETSDTKEEVQARKPNIVHAAPTDLSADGLVGEIIMKLIHPTCSPRLKKMCSNTSRV